MLLSSFAVASALVVSSMPTRVTSSRSMASKISMNMDIMSTAASLRGPDIFWGADGVAQGYEESDIKGQDNFGKFCQAVSAAGLDQTLRSGEYTVFVPTDAAFDDFKGTMTADILKYHVVPGRVPSGSISGDLQTLNGASLTYRRYVRKTFLDNAMIGISSAGASKGQNYPTDVQCSNGLIHAIDMVLVPGEFSSV